MSKFAEKSDLLETETDRVFQWRYEMLMRLGLDDLQATQVAVGTFDLHRARGMLESGCSPEQLVTIASD